MRPNLGRRKPQLNAIVVPASRPASNLDSAVTLARAADCDLVVLCSHQAKAAEVLSLLAARSFQRAVVADIPPGYERPELDFESSWLIRNKFPAFCQSPNGDLSVKRNLGLLLGRMLGWQRMFFMDDDIRDISADDLFTTVSMLGRYSSVGMRVSDFPDNSVVCHAHRATGAAQDIFVSGSVLAIDGQETAGFFPEIYNEDWLFFYENARAHRLGWSGRDVTQLRFDPFANPQRAARQEFGDVLAEGLYALLHQGIGAENATREYWDDFLVAREKFLINVIDRAGVVPPEVRVKMIGAVDIARKCLGDISPSMCERFVEAWQNDLRVWAKQMEAVSRRSSTAAALRAVGLTPVQTDSAEPERSLAAAGRGASSGPVQIPKALAPDRPTECRADRPARGRHRKVPSDARPAPDDRTPSSRAASGSPRHELRQVTTIPAPVFRGASDLSPVTL